MKNSILQLAFLLLIANAVKANVSLPAFFSDNMVLQRNSDAAIWGWASPNEEVSVKTSWDNKEYVIKANNQANWKIKINTPDAGGPYAITIKGYNEITLSNILIGEVWICSGQSNMEMTPAWGITDGEQEIQNANNPNIRFFAVPKAAATFPQDNLQGNWLQCTAATMKNFSAVGYFFAQRLQSDLKDVPIGLISSSWGGTPAEIWMPQEAIEKDTVLKEEAMALHPAQWGPIEPGRAFNAMIHPLVGFKIAGVIWYQGESNVGAAHYEKTFAALIGSWRQLWQYDFPFYFVQIAPYDYGENGGLGAVIRNAQRKVLALPNTGMVVTSDIAAIDDIHPKNKKAVGIRLADLALASTYKTRTGLASGPLFKGITTNKDHITIHFDYADGLVFKDKKSTQFEIAGADAVFCPATATIKNDTVIVYSDKVKNPVKVRYAWTNTAVADLFNKAGLPASSFESE